MLLLNENLKLNQPVNLQNFVNHQYVCMIILQKLREIPVSISFRYLQIFSAKIELFESIESKRTSEGKSFLF